MLRSQRFRIFEEDSNLTNYKELSLSKKVVDKYGESCRYLRHLRINNKTSGVCFIDTNDEEKIIGVVNTELKDDGIWIQAIEVSKDYQKKGYGRKLLDIACKRFKANLLSVRKTNKPAINLYKSYGFKIIKELNEFQYIMKY